MPFPFISRERYEEAQKRITQLEQEKQAWEVERRQLLDRIITGYSGAPLYDKKNPDPVYDLPEPEKPDPIVPSPIEDAIGKHGPRARGIQREIQAKNDREYEEVMRIRSQFQSAAEEGRKLAESGNGHK